MQYYNFKTKLHMLYNYSHALLSIKVAVYFK